MGEHSIVDPNTGFAVKFRNNSSKTITDAAEYTDSTPFDLYSGTEGVVKYKLYGDGENSPYKSVKVFAGQQLPWNFIAIGDSAEGTTATALIALY